MPVTQEPRGLNWINNVNPNALGILVSQICWLAGSLAFTGLVWWLTTLPDYYLQVGAADASGVRQFVLVSRETMRQLGNTLALALLGAWTGKSIIGSVDAHNKRKVIADERKALGGDVANAIATAEHKAVKAKVKDGQTAEVEVEAHSGGNAAPENTEPPLEQPKWADGRGEDHGVL